MKIDNFEPTKLEQAVHKLKYKLDIIKKQKSFFHKILHLFLKRV